MPLPEEICEITVGGNRYRDWKTVEVALEFPGLFRRFALSVTEQVNAGGVPFNFASLQIKPADECKVTLGGELAVSGFVYERQTAMNATTHGVQILGQSRVGDTTLGSIDHKAAGQNGQYEDKSLVTIATDVLKPYGIKVEQKGDTGPMNEPLKDVQVRVNETPHQLIERLARVKGVFIGDDAQGNMILYGGLKGQSSAPASGSVLVEGENIEQMRVIITDRQLANPYIAMGQASADDKTWGKKTAQREYRVEGKGRYRPAILPMERGMSRDRIDVELKRRIDFEKAWREGTQIQAEIVVYGWHKPGGGLWRAAPDEIVSVHSPSALLGQDLAVHKLIFSQDSARGTITTLSLLNLEYYLGSELQI